MTVRWCCSLSLIAHARPSNPTQAGLRSQLEARLAAVSEQVGALAQREAKQEKKRGQCCWAEVPLWSAWESSLTALS